MTLEELRHDIDRTDRELLSAFCRRMTLVKEVAAYKAENGIPLLHRDREREILARVSEEAGEFGDFARVLYKTVLDVSRSCQAELIGGEGALSAALINAMETAPPLFPTGGTVACPGAEGSYAAAACDKLFAAPAVTFVPSFAAVCDAVEQGACQYGILPIENSLYGGVNETYTLLAERSLHIVRGVRLAVRHQLAALPGTALSDIREVTSHEQALGQCAGFLKTLPGVTLTPAVSTALAAKEVAAAGRRDLAVICSPECAARYGLSVLAAASDSDNNHTRFLCVQRALCIYPGADRMRLLVTVPNRPGGLYELMAKFAARELDVTSLVSRPLPGRDFEYAFFLELTASAASENVRRLLEELSGAGVFRFFGNYSEVV